MDETRGGVWCFIHPNRAPRGARDVMAPGADWFNRKRASVREVSAPYEAPEMTRAEQTRERRRERGARYVNPFQPAGKELHWRDLTPEMELALVQRFQGGDPTAGDTLVRIHRRFLYKIAMRYYHPRLDPADLLQEAALGLLRAAARFDPAKSPRLIPYARWWCRAAVAVFAHRTRRIVPFSREVEEALYFLVQHGPDHPLSREYLADPNVRKALAIEEEIPTVSTLDTDETPGVETFLVDTEADPETQAIAAETRVIQDAALREALAMLTPKERRVIEMHDLTEPAMTYDEIGDALGVGRAWAGMIAGKAREKISAFLARKDRGSRR